MDSCTEAVLDRNGSRGRDHAEKDLPRTCRPARPEGRAREARACPARRACSRRTGPARPNQRELDGLGQLRAAGVTKSSFARAHRAPRLALQVSQRVGDGLPQPIACPPQRHAAPILEFERVHPPPLRRTLYQMSVARIGQRVDGVFDDLGSVRRGYDAVPLLDVRTRGAAKSVEPARQERVQVTHEVGQHAVAIGQQHVEVTAHEQHLVDLDAGPLDHHREDIPEKRDDAARRRTSSGVGRFIRWILARGNAGRERRLTVLPEPFAQRVQVSGDSER